MRFCEVADASPESFNALVAASSRSGLIPAAVHSNSVTWARRHEGKLDYLAAQASLPDMVYRRRWLAQLCLRRDVEDPTLNFGHGPVWLVMDEDCPLALYAGGSPWLMYPEDQTKLLNTPCDAGAGPRERSIADISREIGGILGRPVIWYPEPPNYRVAYRGYEADSAVCPDPDAFSALVFCIFLAELDTGMGVEEPTSLKYLILPTKTSILVVGVPVPEEE